MAAVTRSIEAGTRVQGGKDQSVGRLRQDCNPIRLWAKKSSLSIVKVKIMSDGRLHLPIQRIRSEANVRARLLCSPPTIR